MFERKTIVLILAMLFFTAGSTLAEGLEDDWNEFLHYTKIGRLDLAAGYARAVLDSNPEPKELLALSQKNPQGYMILLKVFESTSNTELAEMAGGILDIIEQGRFIRRAEPAIIAEEVRRLSSTARGRLAAVKRLQDAGEYAIPYMLDAMADDSRKDELPNIVWALPRIGRDAIRPLAAALQTDNIALKAEIIKALGNIGYPQSLAHLKYIIEKDNSAQLRDLAAEAIREIDPAALKLEAAKLFYRLAENYYYHAQSLAPAHDADFCNMWFWDSAADPLPLQRQEVDRDYFYELMAMRACEWALRADAGFGLAIGLWQAAFFKAESAGLALPEYFGSDHANAAVYATTAGPKYLHQALARAVKDKNAYVALGVVEALATTAGEKSLLYRIGPAQPLVQALSFDDRAVRYSAAIAIAAAGPKEKFAESKFVAKNLAEAVRQTADQAGKSAGIWNDELAKDYAVRAAEVMLKLAETQNTVVDLSIAQSALIEATESDLPEIQILAGRVLAYLKTTAAQRRIAAMALDAGNDMDVRITAFDSLAISAKFNASLLDSATVNAIYSIVASRDIDPALRSAAAAAFGALNLPSEKVKDLILDQARS